MRFSFKICITISRISQMEVAVGVRLCEDHGLLHGGLCQERRSLGALWGTVAGQRLATFGSRVRSFCLAGYGSLSEFYTKLGVAPRSGACCSQC